MVTFIPAGRMGNYLFELATVISYSIKHNLAFTAPFETSNEKWSPIYLRHLQDNDYNPHLEKVELLEATHEYQEIPFNEGWQHQKNIFIMGYRQSEKYFIEHRDEILYLFDFPFGCNPIISLHARFGDYLTVKDASGKMKHVIVDEGYINDAIKLVKEKTGLERVKVFSDDLEYFKTNFGHLYHFEYSTNTSEYDDIAEMSTCHSHINSSSTFSWWGSWLNRNKNKVIVTQKDWFNDNWMGLNTEDIVPNNWIKI